MTAFQALRDEFGDPDLARVTAEVEQPPVTS